MKSLNALNQLADEQARAIRETLNAVIDAESLIETDCFILGDTALGRVYGEGVVTGLAAVDGANVSVYAINGEVVKGGIGIKNAEKITKCVYNAIKMQIPVIGVIDTMGARFSEGIEALEGYGKIFEAYTDAYKAVPIITVIKGSNFGMLSYLCHLSDFCIVMDGAVMGTSSPLVLAGASKADLKTVGTGKKLISTGVVSTAVKDHAELSETVRKLLAYALFPVTETLDDGNRVAKSLSKGTSAAAVISDVFDAGSFTELYAGFAPEVITGLARLNGIAVGVVANNEKKHDGRLTADAADKINAVIDRLDSLGLPVINLVNCAGAVNDLAAQGAMMRSVADLLYAYRKTTDMPKIALITGRAIGVGYVALAAKSAFDYTIAWDCAEIGMMESLSAAELVYAGEIAKAKDKDKTKAVMAKAYSEETMSAYAVAQKGYVDNVINPKHSRQYLIGALQAFLYK